METEGPDSYSKVEYHLFRWFMLIVFLITMIQILAAKFGVFF